MKILRISAMLMVTLFLFTLATFAAEFVPSIEIKDGPTLVDQDGAEDDTLLITPPSGKDDDNIHEDIVNNLDDALQDLEQALQDLIDNFDEIWDDITGGAPSDNAIISDVFDVRYESELGKDGDSTSVTFRVTVQDIEPEDLFVIITKPYGENAWRRVNFTIDEDGIIRIEGDTKSAYAIIRDKTALPTQGPDGPATAAVEYFVPAIVGIVVFGIAAAFCIVKITKRNVA